MYEELSSQTIIDHEKDESVIILTNDMELQEFQEKESKDAVKKGIEL